MNILKRFERIEGTVVANGISWQGPGKWSGYWRLHLRAGDYWISLAIRYANQGQLAAWPEPDPLPAGERFRRFVRRLRDWPATEKISKATRNPSWPKSERPEGPGGP